jgi:hypothetical protein
MVNVSAALVAKIEAVNVVSVEDDESVFSAVTLQLVEPKLNEYLELFVSAVLAEVKNGVSRSTGEPTPILLDPI